MAIPAGEGSSTGSGSGVMGAESSSCLNPSADCFGGGVGILELASELPLRLMSCNTGDSGLGGCVDWEGEDVRMGVGNALSNVGDLPDNNPLSR